MEAVECGAACVAIILGYFGKWVPIEEVRVACGVTRDGSTARSMLRAARTYGLEAKGYMYSLQTLLKQTPPFIIYWKFNHFIVVEGFFKDGLYVNDPATGPRTVDHEELNKSYTGLILKLTPGEGFVRTGHPPRLWHVLRSRLSRSRQAVTIFCVLSLLLILPGVLLATFARIFIDEVMVGGQSDWLSVLLSVMAGAIIVQAIMTWMFQWILLRMENKLSLHGSAQLLWHLLRLPYVFFIQRMPGDLVNRLQSNDKVAEAFGQDLGRTLAQLFVAAFYVTVVVLFDPVLATVAIGLTGTSVLITFLARRRLYDISVKVELEEIKVFSSLAVAMRTIETIKATGDESTAFTQWAGHHAASINTEPRLGLHTTLVQSLSFLTGGLTTAAVLGLGSLRIMSGDLTVGGVAAIHGMVAAFKLPMENLAGFLTRLEQTRASLQRVDDVLNYELDDDFQASPPTTAARTRKVKLDGHIELRSISFGYNLTEDPLLTNLDLSIKPGSRVALVGGTGSGKTTVSKLVAGLYRPWSGVVMLDGVPANEWALQLRRNSIGWVDQESFLFEGTVLDNLTLWDRSIPESVITQAARDAEVHEVIVSRPGGYGGPVLENGGNFSGGEAQRLELARALAMEPSVLVLDEATSALDPTVEHMIDGNLRRRGCTILIVAHRLSTIRDCDEIIVLDAGHVVERGSHEALLANKGRYREIVEY
jgi:NHLM bacteriocin system ABC transporter peptidase/ATP-binding protein